MWFHLDSLEEEPGDKGDSGVQVATVSLQDVTMEGRLGVWQETSGAWGSAQLQADVRHVSLHGSDLTDAQLQAALVAHSKSTEPICSSILPYGEPRTHLARPHDARPAPRRGSTLGINLGSR